MRSPCRSTAPLAVLCPPSHYCVDLLFFSRFVRGTIKEPSPRYFRIGVELDHVTALAFSDNSKRLVCATAKSRVRDCLVGPEGKPLSAVRPHSGRNTQREQAHNARIFFFRGVELLGERVYGVNTLAFRLYFG